MPSRKRSPYKSRQASQIRRTQARQPLTTDQPICLNIERLSHEGRGIAHYQAAHVAQGVPASAVGKAVFVRYALPGETVRVRLTHSHARRDEGEAVALTSAPAAERVQPFCRYFGQCGGCALQHMSQSAQLQHKQQTLADQLQRIGGIQLSDDSWLAPLTGPVQHYRRRARWAVQHTDDQLRLGFRAVHSHQVVDIVSCPLLEQQLDAQWRVLRQVIHGLQQPDAIDQIEGVAGDERCGWLLMLRAPLLVPDVESLNAFARQQLADLAWQLPGQAVQSMAQADPPLRYHLPQHQVGVEFAVGDFVQVNAAVNQRMVDLALQLLALQPGQRVLDVFCGLGNFSLAAACQVGQAGHVTAVEGCAKMVARAQENARQQGLDQVQFIQADLTRPVTDADGLQQFDAVIIDPPRSGAETLVRQIGQTGAARLVYISCDTATLARDLACLVQQGYQLVKLGIMDMFSQTEHVESIALLVREDSLAVSTGQFYPSTQEE